MRFVKFFLSYISSKLGVCNNEHSKNNLTKKNVTLYVGQEVWHRKRFEFGAGKVTKVSDRTVNVSFNDAEFSGLSIENFTTERPCHENNKPNKVKTKSTDILFDSNMKNIEHHHYFISQEKPSRRLRITHCHGCKERLSSYENKNCSLCNWLVCPKCGSCAFHCFKATKRKAFISSSLRAVSVNSHQFYDETYYSELDDLDDLKQSVTECDYLEDGYNEIDYGYAEDLDWEDR